MEYTLTKDRPSQTLRPRILVVEDEVNLLELFEDVVGRELDCRLIRAGGLAEARMAMSDGKVDLLVTDVNLPDGNGLSLLADLRDTQPNAGAIVITGAPSVDGAISALRDGAFDFLPKPFSADMLIERIGLALRRQAAIARTDKRLGRLRDAVKRLNSARRVVSQKVDLLCNDLIAAYGELSEQLDAVRMQEGFSRWLSNAADLEQLLCHAMDWLLRQMGYSNVAIWLAAEDRHFQLGAYMKYTHAGEEAMTDAMKEGLLPLTVDRGAVNLLGDEVQENLTPAELDYLADQSILSVCCTYLGEPLAVITLFRGGDQPFTDDELALVKRIGPLFAIALTEVVKGSQPSGGGSDHEEDDNENHGRRDDAADWWKRGERPPF